MQKLRESTESLAPEVLQRQVEIRKAKLRDCYDEVNMQRFEGHQADNIYSDERTIDDHQSDRLNEQEEAHHDSTEIAWTIDGRQFTEI